VSKFTEILVNFNRVVFNVCGRQTDRHTDIQTHQSQYIADIR